MEMEFLQLLQASGDVGIWIIVFGLWRMDKRISHLEWTVFNLPKEKAQ